MEKSAKIYVAGIYGMVGGAIERCLRQQGFTNIVGHSSKELDLTNQQAVFEFFQKEKPDFDTSKPDGTPRKLLNVSRLTDLGWKNHAYLWRTAQAPHMKTSRRVKCGCRPGGFPIRKDEGIIERYLKRLRFRETNFNGN